MSRISSEVHPLFTEQVIKALHQSNLHTVNDFVDEDIQQITKITRLTFKDVLSCKRFLLKKYAATPRNGFDYYKDLLSNSALVQTGIRSVDRMLEGGLCSGNIYEICGLPASGKTQFALTLCKNVALNMQQNIYFLDTKNDFSGKRLKNMLNGRGKEKIVAALENVRVKRTLTRYDLINALYEIKREICLEQRRKLRLIVIDSLSALFLNSNDHTENNAFLNQIANVVRYISGEHHIVFLITNLITTWTDGDFKSQQETVERVACGKYWFTVPNTRIKIEKRINSDCVLTILNSDTLTDSTQTANVVITEKGILDSA